MGKRNYLLALSFLLLILVIIISSRFFILKKKYDNLAVDFALQILESERTVNQLENEKNSLVKEYNNGVYFYYPLGVDIEKTMSYTNYVPGPGKNVKDEEAYKEKKSLWEKRLKARENYKVGDSCLDEETDETEETDEEKKEESCSVYSLDKYYVLKDRTENSFDYIIVDQFAEYTFSFEKESDDIFDVILNSFKYTRD